MKVIIDSAEPLDHVLAVIRAVYQIPKKASLTRPAGANTPRSMSRRNVAAGVAPRSGGPDPTRFDDPAPGSDPASDTAAVRAWAREHGFTVNARGRIPETVLTAYRSATS